MQERPAIRPDCLGYFNTFNVLSERRTYNEAGVQPLTVAEIAAYLTELGISGGERRTKFLHMLFDLDSEFMQIQFEKQQQARKT